MHTQSTPMSVSTTPIHLRFAAVALAAGLALPLGACNGSGESTTSGSSEVAQGPSASSSDDAAVEADLVGMADAVNAALAEYEGATQLTLSESATEVAFLYGTIEVPVTVSEATADYSDAVTVTDGTYQIIATSAASGITYSIDQDGTITEQ